jgi:pimeloyl-ACP methyl ester carboxylesterase
MITDPRRAMKLATKTITAGPRTAALVHGASMSTLVWRDFGDILAAKYDITLTLVDLRGHGDSDRADSYTVGDFADDLVETLPSGLDFLIGQSLGGVSSAWAAERLQPKRYIGLDPAFTASPSAAWALRTLGPIQPRMPSWMLRAMGSPPKGAAPDTLALFRASWKKWDSSMMKQLVHSGVEHPFVVVPPPVPSTIVLADKSFVIPAPMATGFSEAGWDVRDKPGAVHDMHVQDPVGLAALLDDLLKA